MMTSKSGIRISEVGEDPTLKILEERLAKSVMKKFFKHYGVASQSINSYNRFVKELPGLLTAEPMLLRDENANATPIQYEMHFTAVKFVKPWKEQRKDRRVPLYPNECRLRSLTYSAEIWVDGFYVKNQLLNGIWETTMNASKRKRREMNKDLQTSPDIGIPFNTMIGKLPILVRSELCNLSTLKRRSDFERISECFRDPGGYFIIKGKEKVLISQKKLPENRMLVFEPLKHNRWICECEFRSKIDNSLLPVRALWVRLIEGSSMKVPVTAVSEIDGEVAGASQTISCINPTTAAKLKLGVQFTVVGPLSSSRPIPLVWILQALGVPDLEFVKKWIFQGDESKMVDKLMVHLIYSLELWDDKLTPIDAIDIIGCYIKQDGSKGIRQSTARKYLNYGVLPHIGNSPRYDIEKAMFLCDMVRRVCDSLIGNRPYEDRDNLVNQRIRLPGDLFLNLFSKLWRNLANDMLRGVKRRRTVVNELNMAELIRKSVITNGFEYAIKTGNWHGLVVSDSISQDLNRCSYISTLAQLRRIASPVDKLVRNTKARMLHNTAFGMICPYETPEGEPIGLMNNLAISACVTAGSSSYSVVKCLEQTGLVQKCATASMELINHGCKVMVNGRWLGYISDVQEVISQLKEERKKGNLSSEVSIYHIEGCKPELEVRSDGGRIMRPLYVVNKELMNCLKSSPDQLIGGRVRWTDLLRLGFIEELDTGELMNCNVTTVCQLLGNLNYSNDVVNSSYTHAEIHPSLILGLCASTIPFATMNPAARNQFESGMVKQAIGIYATNFSHRNDLSSHILWYPQKPLVPTLGSTLTNLWELPCGTECVTAIMSWTGYNQEDSLMFNKSAIERGLFRSFASSTYMEMEQAVVERASAKNAKIERLERPHGVKIVRSDTFEHLDDDGLPCRGIKVTAGIPVIGKTIQIRGGAKEDMSTHARLNTTGCVRAAYVTDDECGNRKHVVIVDETRAPKIGDKFTSRHGQKGVIGMVYSQEDLPFTCDGIVPDIIINPHAFPSRMTIAHLIEGLTGKAITMNNKTDISNSYSGTPFSVPVTAETFADIFNAKMRNKYGEEIMYDPATGRKFEATVFVGVNYYERLRHMVDDKISMRSRGPVSGTIGQPSGGLMRDGAQRFGEMEKDCVIAHGVASFFHERLFTVSDEAYVPVCNKCGIISYLQPFFNTENKVDRHYMCPCGKNEEDDPFDIYTIALPRAAKLLYQELMAMNIKMKFILEWNDLPGMNNHSKKTCQRPDFKDEDYWKKVAARPFNYLKLCSKDV